MSEKTSAFGVLKIALYSTVIAYVLLCQLMPFTQEPSFGSAAAASRQILMFFCLAGLGLMLFPRSSTVRLGLGLTALSAFIEAAQLAPMLDRSSDLLDVVAAASGVMIALAPVVIGRAFPLQVRGASPTSLSFLP